MDGVDTGKVVEVVELVEVGESGSGGSSGGDGGDDWVTLGVAIVVNCSSRLLIRSSSDGRALSRGLPNPNIRSAEMGRESDIIDAQSRWWAMD